MHLTLLRLCSFLILCSQFLPVVSQSDVFQLMERKDLTLDEIERRAALYFQEHGTGKGSGNNQYQRWLYERRFHTDEKGYYIDPETEDRAYHQAVRNMGVKSRGVFAWKEVGPKTWNQTSSWNPGWGGLHPLRLTLLMKI